MCTSQKKNLQFEPHGELLTRVLYASMLPTEGARDLDAVKGLSSFGSLFSIPLSLLLHDPADVWNSHRFL